MTRLAPAIVAALLTPLLLAGGGADDGRPPLNLDWDISTRVVTWSDVDGAVSYRVSGTIGYANLSCDAPLPRLPGATFDFSEELSGRTTSFQLPAPQDRSDLSIKDATFTIEALDDSGGIVARDGFGLTVDGFCEDEALPSTGAALSAKTNREPLLAAITLTAVGVILVSSALIVSGRRS